MANAWNRRSVLRIGALGMGGFAFHGFSLGDILRAEAAAGVRASRKAVINIHLDGGPPHLDMIDPKPLAPREIRGEFQPISTQVPGIHISELMPRVANQLHDFALIRSLVGAAGVHDAFQCQSGYDAKNLQSIGGRPAMGSVVSKLQGSALHAAPSFVDLMQGRALVRNSARPGFLGASYQPFRPDISRLFTRKLEAGMEKELQARGANHAVSLALSQGLSVERLSDRTSLLAQLDSTARDLDSHGMMNALDAFQQQAVGILTSGSLAKALDLSTEQPRILANYTDRELARAPVNETSEGVNALLKFLLCRRLIQVGVRCVSVSLSDFDTHSDNFPRMKQLVPVFDLGLTALVNDLREHDLLDDVMIVVWGEFGRTPNIHPKTGGRDHWPQVGMAMLAGGGIRGGQVLGATDRIGGAAISQPVEYQDIFATLYQHLGIAAKTTTLNDPAGRPQYILDRARVLHELL